MKITLLLLRGSDPCERARITWQRVCAQHSAALDVLYHDEAAGRALLARHDLHALPAAFVDGRLAAVGVQTSEEARRLIRP